ncbi:MAG: hypothetical protein GX111_00335 [Clostridiales bacterium]|nr:hypothetical protein [Clostridiales bacterium]
MECPECKQPLMVARSRFRSEEKSTEVYNELTLVCVNPKCKLYGGPDLSSPVVVAKVVKNKVG